jgi:hypothetical protein
MIVCQAVGLFLRVLKMSKRAGARIVPVQPAQARADPKISVVVFDNIVDPTVADAVEVAGVALERGEVVPVVTI